MTLAPAAGAIGQTVTMSSAAKEDLRRVSDNPVRTQSVKAAWRLKHAPQSERHTLALRA